MKQISSILLILVGSKLFPLSVLAAEQVKPEPVGSKPSVSIKNTVLPKQKIDLSKQQMDLSAQNKPLSKPNTGLSKPAGSQKASPQVQSRKESAPSQGNTSSKSTASIKESDHPKVAKKHNVFVPPPPPSVPTMSEIGYPGMGPVVFMGENLEFMPIADLKELKARTEMDLSQIRRKVEGLITSSTEKKQRADSFEQLYTEGVVSRRELEHCKSDSEKTSQDLSETKQNLVLLERKFARIEKRIADLSKTRKSALDKLRSRHK